MADTLCPKRRMVRRPNVGTSANLHGYICGQIVRKLHTDGHIPHIEDLDDVVTGCNQNSNEVRECTFPDPKFEFVHQVRHKEVVYTSSELGKSNRERALRK